MFMSLLKFEINVVLVIYLFILMVGILIDVVTLREFNNRKLLVK